MTLDTSLKKIYRGQINTEKVLQYLCHREMEIKNKRYHQTPRTAKIHNSIHEMLMKILSNRNFHSLTVGIQMLNILEDIWTVSHKNITYSYHKATIVPLGVYPNKLKYYVHTQNLHTNVSGSFTPIISKCGNNQNVF